MVQTHRELARDAVPGACGSSTGPCRSLRVGIASLDKVPTLEGAISASSGLALVPALWGSVNGAEPLPAATTDLGTILLRPGGNPGV
jgi:hypothetical protein